MSGLELINTGHFAPTRWTCVRQACGTSEEARAALSELCAIYYAPVGRFIAHAVRDPEAARDLTHEFFARLLAGQTVDFADPERGRFRSFLLTAVKHFLADARDRQCALKRGGGAFHEPLDVGTATSPGFDMPDRPNLAPDASFDRNWALALLGCVLAKLERELVDEGKTGLFTVLKPWLPGGSPMLSQAEAAVELGMSEGAVKVTIHRLRRRFRELIKAEIAETLAEEGDVEGELRHLLMALS